ncbi:DsbA family protein [Nocardioides sp.]|uniref:DsbA family oxidoreductase n=1 Tax=Nocardioides sp. TaxID=35761 RepID=UPI00262616C8|nr:DsbA family protein [Nocardioides sp.]MDI6912069.1 DsbA family protein [Nocardioides sp.]
MTRQATSSTTGQLVLYGDFTCPWSYLASRRVDALVAAGLRVDWRAVRAPAHDARTGTDRFPVVRRELDLVAAGLRADEGLPYALAGFVPETAAAAVTGYAEAYAAGAAELVRHLLFDAFWAHGCDVGDAQVVHTLVVDAIRSGWPPGHPRADWGYAVVGDDPVAPAPRHLVARWTREWRATGLDALPVLVLDDEAPLSGAAAVARLADELLRRTADRRWSRTPALPHAG